MAIKGELTVRNTRHGMERRIAAMPPEATVDGLDCATYLHVWCGRTGVGSEYQGRDDESSEEVPHGN